MVWRQKNEKQLIFPIFLNWLLCKLKFLMPIINFIPHSPVLLAKLCLCFSWARWIQSTHLYPVYSLLLLLLLLLLLFQYRPPLYSSSFQILSLLQLFLRKPCTHLSFYTFVIHFPSCIIFLDFITPVICGKGHKLVKFFVMTFSLPSCHFLPLGSQYSLQHPFLKHPQCATRRNCINCRDGVE